MHDDRIGGLVGRLHARDRAALQAVLGVLRGVLIGDLGEREALNADAEPGLVHHHEHRVQAAVRLAHEPAGRLVVVDDAGGVAVNAHLLFDRAAGDAVGTADAAVGIDFQLRRHEQRNALHALGRAFDAREHEVHDVLRKIVLAGRNENLGAGNLVAAVLLRRGLGADEAEIGAALRLGQVHRARPLAGGELGEIFLLLFVVAVDRKRAIGALRKARIHAEGHVGGGNEFVHRGVDRVRETLAAIFGFGGKADPAAFGHLPVGFLEALRRRHRAVGVALAAFLVAHAVERLQHFLAEFRAFAEDRRERFDAGIGKARQIVVALDVKDILQEKEHVVDRRFIAWHFFLRPLRFRRASARRSSSRCGRSRVAARRSPGRDAAAGISGARFDR